MVKGQRKTKRPVSSKKMSSVIKRTVRDYRRTLRRLAAGPNETKRG